MNDIVTKAEADRAGMDDRIMVSVQAPLAESILAPAARALIAARDFTIATAEDVTIATAEARSAKLHWDQLEAMRTSLKGPIDEAAANVQRRFKPALDRWSEVAKEYRDKMGAYAEEQRRIAAAAQAKADEAARKERERLEREAAKAEAAGKVEVAEAKRVALDELEMAPTAVQAPEKMEGVSIATTYDAELVNMLDLAKYIIKNPMYLPLLTIEPANVRRLAQSLRDQFAIPGLKLVKKSQARVRK
jgi:F0F1-type ATP synthase membrane subunit b/b'